VLIRVKDGQKCYQLAQNQIVQNGAGGMHISCTWKNPIW